jgi:hypothetical protein
MSTYNKTLSKPDFRACVGNECRHYDPGVRKIILFLLYTKFCVIFHSHNFIAMSERVKLFYCNIQRHQYIVLQFQIRSTIIYCCFPNPCNNILLFPNPANNMLFYPTIYCCFPSSQTINCDISHERYIIW